MIAIFRGLVPSSLGLQFLPLVGDSAGEAYGMPQCSAEYVARGGLRP